MSGFSLYGENARLVSPYTKVASMTGVIKSNKDKEASKNPSTNGRVKVVGILDGRVGELYICFIHYNNPHDLLVPAFEVEKGVDGILKYVEDTYTHSNNTFSGLLKKILPELKRLLKIYFKKKFGNGGPKTTMKQEREDKTITSFDELYGSLPVKTWKEIEQLIEKAWIEYGKEEKVGGEESLKRCKVVAEFLVKRKTPVKREDIIRETLDEFKPIKKSSESQTYDRILKFLQCAGVIRKSEKGVYHSCYRLVEEDDALSGFTVRLLRKDIEALKEGQQRTLSLLEKLFGRENNKGQIASH